MISTTSPASLAADTQEPASELEALRAELSRSADSDKIRRLVALEVAAALKPLDQHKPGLPPLAMRKVHQEWEDFEGDSLWFHSSGEWYSWFGTENFPYSVTDYLSLTSAGYPLRPVGKTWAEVEALAAAVSP